jgi:hypothetical protein
MERTSMSENENLHDELLARGENDAHFVPLDEPSDPATLHKALEDVGRKMGTAVQDYVLDRRGRKLRVGNTVEVQYAHQPRGAVIKALIFDREDVNLEVVLVPQHRTEPVRSHFLHSQNADFAWSDVPAFVRALMEDSVTVSDPVTAPTPDGLD